VKVFAPRIASVDVVALGRVIVAVTLSVGVSVVEPVVAPFSTRVPII
jgi:hypothetical protein